MLNIAICDDDQSQMKLIEAALRRLEESLHEHFSIECFSDGAALLTRCESLALDYYAIIFFDIVMGEKSGIETAKQLRENGWLETKFIFVSSHEKYFRELYALDTAGFIDKPFTEVVFEKVFMDAYRMICEEDRCIYCFKKDRVKQYVRVSNIAYIDIFNRVVTLHMKNGETYDFYATIAEVWAFFKERPEFVAPIKSAIVNLNYVQLLDGQGFHLVNKQLISIGRKNSEETFARYFAYLRRRGE